jgi:hypothetical protein
MHFQDVPTEVVREIFRYLYLKDLCSVICTSTRGRHLCRGPVEVRLGSDGAIPSGGRGLLTGLLSSQRLQVLDLSFCRYERFGQGFFAARLLTLYPSPQHPHSQLQDMDVQVILGCCTNLTRLILKGCRQLTRLEVTQGRVFEAVDCSGTSVGLVDVRVLASGTKWLDFRNTPALFEYLQETPEVQEGVIMQLSLSSLPMQLPQAAEQVGALLEAKAATGDAVAAALLRTHRSCLTGLILDAPLDANLHTLVMASVMALPEDDQEEEEEDEEEEDQQQAMRPRVAEVVKTLVGLGADPVCSTNTSLTPLHLAWYVSLEVGEAGVPSFGRV